MPSQSYDSEPHHALQQQDPRPSGEAVGTVPAAHTVPPSRVLHTGKAQQAQAGTLSCGEQVSTRDPQGILGLL